MPAILFLTIASLFFSFNTAGGDKYEIFINNKLVYEHYVNYTTAVKTITLSSANYNTKVDVRYSHCGQTGKDRRLIIQDDYNKVIKKWGFANGEAMSMKAKDIIDLRKKNKNLQLYYASKEIPQGKLLATVVIANSNYTSIK